MASPRIAVCFLAILATVSAFVMAGCGGDSSAPATTGGTSATTASDGGSGKEASAEGQSSGGEEKKKHPPLDLPTGTPEKGPTQKQRSSVPTADIELSRPGQVVTGITPLPVDNTCDGKDVSPALEWSNVPSGTEELALFAMNLAPVNGKLYFDWAVTGLDPSAEGIEEGKLPDGAVIGKNSAGKTEYSICPKSPEGETYVFALYAMSEAVPQEEGFDARGAREKAIDVSPNVGIYTVSHVPKSK